MAGKTRELKVCYRSERRDGGAWRSPRYVWVPSISLAGKWLEECGFGIGEPISVACEEGRIVITRR